MSNLTPAPLLGSPAPAHRADAGYPLNHRLVGWLSVAQLISWGSVFYLFALIMAPVEASLGVSRAQSSLAFSLALLTEGFLAYPVGRWIDKGYERRVMTAGSLILALCLALHTQVNSLASLYAVWLGLGIGMSATLYTPVFAVVTRRFPLDFRKAIITLTFLGGLASTVFIPLIAWLVAHWGWRTALWPLAAFQLLVCAPLHFYWLNNAPLRAMPDKPEPDSPALTDTPSATAKAAPTASLAQHLASAQFALVGLFVVASMAVTAALPTHMVNLLRENGLKEAWAIAIPASIGVIQVLGRLLLYFFEHRFDVHAANRLIPALIPVSLVVLMASPFVGAFYSGAALALMFVFVVLWGFGNGMQTIVKGTAMAQYVSREHVASLNGALGVPLALSRAAAPLALGLLWTPQVGYRYGLWLLLGLGAVGVLALVWAQRLASHSSPVASAPGTPAA